MLKSKKPTNKTKYLAVLKIYWQYTAPSWKLLLVAATLVTASVLIGYSLSPYLISRILDGLVSLEGQGTSPVYYQLIQLAIYLFISSMTLNFGWRIAEFTSDKLMVRASNTLSQESFKSLISQSYQFFTDQFAGSLVNKYKRFFKNYRVIYREFMFSILTMSVRIIAAAVIVSIASPAIGLAFVAWVMIFSVVMIYLYRRSSDYADRATREDTLVTGILSDNLSNGITIKAFGSSEYEERRFATVVQAQLTAYLGYWKRSNLLRFVQVIGISIFETLTLYLTIVAVARGSLTLGMAILMQFYFRRVFSDLWDLGKLIEGIEQALHESWEMLEIIDTIPDILDKTSAVGKGVTLGRIEFKQVGFGYANEQSSVFEGFSLQIEPG
ncbi:ABC transporter ATP-binding protein [Candidatus Nomurabacteria bacterium]|nr:ABC transporter ATP-binding protein [Candidatus Nomurabacteria bacterium]